MATNHFHSHPEESTHQQSAKNHSAKPALSLAFWLNLTFSVVELVGGILTNSTAIIADAFHDFMDAGAIGLAILTEKISDKKRSSTFSYGFKRFSLVSSLALTLFLMAGSVTMFMAGFSSITATKEIDSTGMLWLAVLGLAVNGFAFFRLKNEGHHHHGHTQHNHNSQSIMLHLFEDVLGWAAVLVGAVIIHFTGLNWIDGVLAIGIALYIGYNATRNLIRSLRVMLQSVPENVNLKQLISEVQKIEGVINVHDVHVWSLDGSYNVGSLHALVKPSAVAVGQDILDKLIDLMQKHHIQHPTVQIETHRNRCSLEHC